MAMGDWEFVDKSSQKKGEKKKGFGDWEFIEKTEAKQKDKLPLIQGDYDVSDIARVPVNAGASLVAGFGAIPKGLAYLAQKGIEAGGAVQNYLQDVGESPEQVEKNRLAREATGSPFASLARELQEGLPEYGELKERIGKNLPEGYLEPKSQAEEVLTDAAGTLGGLLFPLSAGTKIKAGRAAAEAGLGDLSKFLTSSFTGSKEHGEKAKIGTMIGVGFGLGSSLKNISGKIFDRVNDKGKSIIIPASKSQTSSFLKLGEDLAAHGGEALKKNKEILEKSMPYLQKFYDGSQQVTLADLAGVNRTINNIYKDIPKSSPAMTPVLNFMKRNKAHLEHLAQSGGELGSGAKDLLRANEIYTGVKASERALDWLKEHPKINKILEGSSILPLYLTVHSPEKLIPFGAGVGALAGGSILYQHMKNLYKLPAVRKEVASIFQGAVKENAPEVIKHMHKLEGIFKKNPEELEYIRANAQPEEQLEYIRG